MKIGQRMFPSRKKRKVIAEISTWKNYDPDAHHYRVKIREEDNWVWTGQSWTYSSENKDCQGIKIINGKVIGNDEYPYQPPFNSYKSAERYCKDMFKKYFSTRTHKLVIEEIE